MYSVRHSLDHVSSTSCGWPQLSWLYPHKKHQSFPSGGAVTPCALRVGLSQPCCCYSASLPSDSYSAHYTDHFVAGQESTCLGHNSIVLEIQANRKSLVLLPLYFKSHAVIFCSVSLVLQTFYSVSITFFYFGVWSFISCPNT